MIFKNYSESAQLLSVKILEEEYTSPTLVYLTEESFDFAMEVATRLRLRLSSLVKILQETSPNFGRQLIMVDSGIIRGNEYTQYSDKIRKISPETNLTIAVPVIPQSEETVFKSNCDRLITLAVEPLFFSIDQFYQTSL